MFALAMVVMFLLLLPWILTRRDFTQGMPTPLKEAIPLAGSAANK